MPATTLLVAEKVSRRHGERTVLEDVDLTVQDGSRIGLIGPNGSGKTTLLRILAGAETPDSGTVATHGRVGLLSSEPDRTRTGREAILRATGLLDAAESMSRWEARLAGGDTTAIDGHAAALQRWLDLGGADADARLTAAGAELGLDPEMLDRPLSALSGGQAARVGLAAITLARYDVTLLDEPTNDLDGDGLSHLRRCIAQRSGGVVIVAHDRQLLADVCEEIVALDLHGGGAIHYRGGYDAYERERELAHRRALEAHRDATARRDALLTRAEDLRRSAETAAGRSAASFPDHDKNVRYAATQRAQATIRRARGVAARADRIEIPDKPWEDAALALSLTGARPHGSWVASLEGAHWRRGNWSLGPLDLAVAAGERLALSGPNGAGKSTVLATLAGREQPDAGRVQIARATVIAELGQLRTALARDRPLRSAVHELTGLGESEARTVLARFGLGADRADRSATSLSPGERTRAELAVLAHRQATCLLLDEPSNHLDIESIGVLESALADWPGALVFATHDARLRDRLAPDREVALARE